MNNKKAKIFLCVSLICFVLIAIVIIISIRLVNYSEELSLANGPSRPEFGGIIMYIAIYTIIIPGLATMLSGIRSTYKLLKYKPKGDVKICYLISASLAFLAIAVMLLCYIGGLIIIVSNFFISMMIITMWPSFIISFVLGSIPINRKKEDNV